MVFNKIFEIMKSRLVEFWNKHNVLTPTQFGFRENSSMKLATVFDAVNHEILLYKLEQYGVRGVANDFMKSYLTNRKQFLSRNGFSSSILGLNIGVPRGSVLGPILFLTAPSLEQHYMPMMLC